MNDVANVVPFRKGSGRSPRSRALGRVECELHSAAILQQQAEALHQAHWNIAEAWRLRAESAAIKRRYEERQRKIEVLLAGIPADVERA